MSNRVFDDADKGAVKTAPPGRFKQPAGHQRASINAGSRANARYVADVNQRLSPKRPPFEFYPTPREGTRALLSVEAFDGSIWEPACGQGAISTELIAAGYEVVSSDLVAYGFGIPAVDFLRETKPRAKHIVTNPPYGRGLADRFIGHALMLTRETGGSVAMLLNVASLCHPLRHAKFLRSPPAAIYGLDHLVCWPNGNPHEATPSTRTHRYCWVVWKPGHQGRPSFWWLSTAPFRSPKAF